MKPIDRFSYLKNNRVSQDTSSLVQCYLPIIGQEALSLYLYTISFWDNGRKEYLFSSILNHLNFGMDRLIKSLKILSAFNLLTLYQKGDVYQLALHAPLSSQDFLEHPVYRRLLEKKIGDAAVEDLRVESAEGEERPVSLNQVFPDLAELDEITYVRFASVYRSFKDVSELESLLQQITQSSKKKKER